MSTGPFNPVIVYRVTDYCNLNCVFCAHARSLTRPRVSVDPKDVLSLGLVLSAYRKETGNRVLVNWLGGEPLLWKPAYYLSEEYKRLGVDVSATTNGVALKDPKVREHILDNYSQLTISVDSFAAMHDQTRGLKGLYALVEQAVPALARERDKKGAPLHIRMNTVLMRENFTQFPELFRTFASWGVNEITYNQLGGRDRPENFAALRLQPDQIEDLEKVLPSLKKEMDAKGVFINTNPSYIARFKAYARDEFIDVKDCQPGEGFLFIDEKSRIAPCNFTVEEYNVPVREVTTVKAFRDLPRRFSEMQQAHQNDACRNCMSTRVSGKFTPAP